MKKLLALCLSLVLILSCSGCAANPTDKDVSSESVTASTESGDLLDSDNLTNSTDMVNSDVSSDEINSNDSTGSDNSVSSTEADEADDSNESSKSDNSGDSANSTTDKPGFTLCFHSYKKATCTTPKTCTKCGKTKGDANGHEFSDATCTAPKTCTVCKKTSGKALGHSYADATCSSPKTCNRCNATNGSALGHSYIDATCTAPTTCAKCGKTRGSALGHSYVAGECTRKNNGKICGDYSESYCPKLYLTGDMSQITDPAQTSKKIECNIGFEYRSSDKNFNGAAQIKIQGSSSTRYAKKNYTINFYEDSNYSSKKKIDVGWGAQSKYCLKANWIDKTHSRNVVTAGLAGEVQAKYDLFNVAPHNGTIDGFPVEIYINGEFHGLYTMNIPKDEWMFGMDKDNPDHIVICGENWNDPVLFKSVPTDLNDWTVEAGPEDDATLAKVQRLVKFVKDSSDAEFKANFSQYLNLDSTLNYYVMMNYFWASDNTGKNMLLATYDGKVWYPTMYDLDTTWGTNWRGDGIYNYSSGFVNGSNSNLWSKFEKNFKKEIAQRYFELRADILDTENVMASFNNFYSKIPQEVLDREKAKWEGFTGSPLPGYDYSQIQDYLDKVVPRLDAKFNSWK
ncbi:MAG: CotH kinase family protein [Clostridia bacterium]|nr:CotH kinase family protein [Clostridia bacterium]